MDTLGKLYGIGVGPGDADLITVKAVKILGLVEVIFTASSSENDFSLALEIARPHLRDDVDTRILSFPMKKDRSVMNEAWEKHAATIAGEVSKGLQVAFLTLGDPLTYSTFGYILQKLDKRYPQIPIETIPGITSFQASAARINTPLVEGEESLLVTSGAAGGDNLRKIDGKIENVVLLKAYKHLPDIVDALEQCDMLATSTAISRCGRDDESITRDLAELVERRPDYWTLVIAKKNLKRG